MAIVDNVQLRFGNPRGEDLGVDQRDDRVVVAVHDQCRLAQRLQPREAGPAPCGKQLIQVAAAAKGPDMTAVLSEQFVVTAICAAIEVSADPAEELPAACLPNALRATDASAPTSSPTPVGPGQPLLSIRRQLRVEVILQKHSSPSVRAVEPPLCTAAINALALGRI